jgi:MoaA/NifB/PqqE/SkfB family radical SAM enzyme
VAPQRPIRGLLSLGQARLRRASARLRRRVSVIEYIAADIVNNCNLRCPFCLVDYDQVKSTNLMSEDTFRSLIRLAPVVPEAGFWLSCLHEPTLHPHLREFIEMIPRAQRRKFWFTTNLTRPLPDTLVSVLARSGLHHLNISCDTFDADLFAVLRKHGRLKAFRENLDRLISEFRRTPGAPRIRYITMAYRSNLTEIPNLVRWMNEKGNALEIEIRYTFNTANIAETFRNAEFLRPHEWLSLRDELRRLPYGNYLLSMPPSNYATEAPYVPANWFDAVPVTSPPHSAFRRPLQLRARPDGRLHLSGAEDLFAVQVNDLDDPISFFHGITEGHPVPSSPPAR